jgi:hypothetical protein
VFSTGVLVTTPNVLAGVVGAGVVPGLGIGLARATGVERADGRVWTKAGTDSRCGSAGSWFTRGSPSTIGLVFVLMALTTVVVRRPAPKSLDTLTT